jgi:hypothetical protein
MRWCLGSRCSPCLGDLRCRGRLWVVSYLFLKKKGVKIEGVVRTELCSPHVFLGGHCGGC